MLCDEPQDVFEPGNNRLGVEEIFKGIHPALLKLVEWNRQITAFTSLTIDDQAKLKLMQASWCEHYTLKVVNQLDLETDAVCRCGGKTCWCVASRDKPMVSFANQSRGGQPV